MRVIKEAISQQEVDAWVAAGLLQYFPHSANIADIVASKRTHNLTLT